MRRKVALLLTSFLLLLALLVPEAPSSKKRFLAVVDITRSMNAKDYGGLSRLEAAKQFLQRLVEKLPCGSELGMGLFSHREVVLLWQPVEVCKHGPALRMGIENVSWRSAWAMDSYIAEGVKEAIQLARKLDAELLFLTDGDRYPPEQKWPKYMSKGKGWLIGVGFPSPSPIPKFDQEGRRVIGFWRQRDLPVYFDPHLRKRLKVRDPHKLVTTRLDEAFLEELATESGLRYRHFNERGGLVGEIASYGGAERLLNSLLLISILMLI